MKNPQPLSEISEEKLIALVHRFDVLAQEFFSNKDHGFYYTHQNLKLIKELIKHYTGHKSVFNPRLGFLVMGERGRGKTSIFTILNRMNERGHGYRYQTCEDMGESYEIVGYEAFAHVKSKNIYDDLCREKQIYKHFDKPLKVMQHVIDKSYRNWQFTGEVGIWISNADEDKIRESYEDRSADCLFQMNNKVIFEGDNWRVI